MIERNCAKWRSLKIHLPSGVNVTLFHWSEKFYQRPKYYVVRTIIRLHRTKTRGSPRSVRNYCNTGTRYRNTLLVLYVVEVVLTQDVFIILPYSISLLLKLLRALLNAITEMDSYVLLRSSTSSKVLRHRRHVWNNYKNCSNF
jgi:hypothetical protein